MVVFIGCCMKYSVMLRREFSIIESDDKVNCTYTFLMLQERNLSVAVVIFQYCDGASDGKFPSNVRTLAVPYYLYGQIA